MKTTLYIKNMCCDRCIAAMCIQLKKDHLDVFSVRLGEVMLNGSIKPIQLRKLETEIRKLGFAITTSHPEKVVIRIKSVLLELINSNENYKINISEYISSKLNLTYQYLSKTFSKAEKHTIEQYFIELKIEKIKEMLLQNEFTVSQIANRSGYGNAQSLSAQFKKITGKTPSEFKKIQVPHRKNLSSL